MATIASAIGVARIPTQGSCRPCVTTSAGFPSVSMLRPGSRRLEVGLSAMLARMSWPEEIPPSIPPALFCRKPSGVISSRFSVPRISTTRKPAPISTPLTALMLIRAWARSASRRSNTGSPSPGGTPLATTSTRAPMESPDFLSASMKRAISSATSASGQKNGLRSTSSQSKAAGRSGPSWARWPRTRMPARSRRYFFATPPAATLIVVSRADDRPPPR